MNKLTTSLFYISTVSDNSQISMNNTYAYELMVNLLNEYFIAFERLILINLKDFVEKSRTLIIKVITIFCISLFFSILYLIAFWKIMSKLDRDREKPINLFLTIKKKIFEDLKNSAENFSNKLLNKYFGVDENEEESQKDYKTNIKPSDINIAKFKALNEFKSSKKNNSFFSYFINLTIFFFIYIIFSLLKFINTVFYSKDMLKFSQIYNSTQFSQIYSLTNINIIKQYFYNSSIINYNLKREYMIINFYGCFLRMTDQLEETIKQTSKTTSFLKRDYKALFTKYMYNNFSDILSNDSYLNEIDDFEKQVLFEKPKYGFKSISFEIFEFLRILMTNYFIELERNKSIVNTTSYLINDDFWVIVNELVLSFVRPWYKFINKSIDQSFYSMLTEKYTQYIFMFVVLIVLIIIYYLVIWKRNENEFIRSINKSFDLINLMPEEIKNIIVSKLNE